MFVGSLNNLKRLNGAHFMLKTKTHTNKSLQADWNEFGAEAFETEILEHLKKKDEAYFDEKKELEKLEAKWLDILKPYGQNGYNTH
ncbi:MAG: GIY-YIG nuclease family protein [Lysinibacillus sp.]